MEEPKTNDQTLNVFKTINGFVKNMNECYGSNQKTLQLYARLISKTTIEDDAPISRHIAAFTKFCAENKDAILEKNYKKLANPKISYNEKVYINMLLIFKAASAGERVVIWKHILTIYAFIDPQSKAKEMLREVIDKDGKGGKEEEFLTDIFDKVGNNIQPDGNPLQAVGNLMSSGIFTDIVGSMSSGLENGELDLGRLMGSMQGMVTNIGSMADQNGQSQQPEMAEMLGQMTAMMGNLNKMSDPGSMDGKPGATPSVSEDDLARGSELAKGMINSQQYADTTAQAGVSSEPIHSDTTPKFEIVEDTPEPPAKVEKASRRSKKKDK
jgi:hypothetical protein